MANQFLTNYTQLTFLDKIKDNLRHCKSFAFSVSLPNYLQYDFGLTKGE